MREGLIESDYWIAQDAKIGARADAHYGIARLGIAGVEMCHRGRTKMSAGREPEDADLRRIYAKFLGPRSHGADRSLGVLQRRGMAIALATMAIVADEPGDAMLIQPATDLVPFVVHCQAAVAAAWANHNTSAGWLFRQIDDQRRRVFRLNTQRAGSAGGPEQLGLGLSSGC